MEQWMGTTGVMAITAVAYLAGEAVKLTPLPARFIPVLCMAVGGVLGCRPCTCWRTTPPPTR